MPFNPKFDTLGFGSQNTIDNFGSVNIVFGMVVVQSLLIFLLYGVLVPLTRHRKLRFRDRLVAKYKLVHVSHGWMRFLLQLNCDLLLMCLISVLPGDEPNILQVDAETPNTADWFMIGYTFFLIFALTLFVVVFFGVLMRSRKELMNGGHFAVLFDGVRENYTSLWFNFFYIVRRTGMIFTIFWIEAPAFQVHILVFLALLN